jgi:diaminopimelate decarboxylase
VRVNAASLIPDNSAIGDRIGIDVADLTGALDVAHSFCGVLDGLHIYVGTNFQSPNAMLPALEGFFRHAFKLTGLRYLNIGGGVGIDYTRAGSDFDLALFGASVGELYRGLISTVGRPIRLLFEPGRGLIARSGLFLTAVTDVKKLRGQDFVVVDGSVAVFPRPLLHPESPHRVRRLGERSENNQSNHDVSIVGKTTYSRDILARCRVPNDICVGDVLVFEDAGAYCSSMASRFLGRAMARSW